MDWKALIKDLAKNDFNNVAEQVGKYDIYTQSLLKKEDSYFFMTKVSGKKRLVIINKGTYFDKFIGEVKTINDVKIKIAKPNHENAVVLRQVFDFTNPRPFGNKGTSFGLGDRLGIATPGHLASVRDKDVQPVIAQQSMRELSLTDRNYEDVLDSASWAVFQEGYQEGFGADGDHLKKKAEIKMALDMGFSMITLDCIEHIDKTIKDLDDKKIDEMYLSLPDNNRLELEKLYLNNSFMVDDIKISYTEKDFRQIVLIYSDMIEFSKEIYYSLIKTLDREIDFEISVDESATPTTPQAHYFIAAELERAGIEVNSLAPRFCGEFQKGIDYIGDLNRFEREFVVHSKIANNFGYKLSIHSGSDKFTIYPIIGKYTDKRVHVKTAGTSWLEAMQLIAELEPKLYREIHQFALDNFEKATEYYHVTTDLNNIPDIEDLADQDLPQLFINNDCRQLIHITYGLILQTKKDGSYIFRDRLYEVWENHEKDYSQALQRHIGRHLQELGIN